MDNSKLSESHDDDKQRPQSYEILCNGKLFPNFTEALRAHGIPKTSQNKLTIRHPLRSGKSRQEVLRHEGKDYIFTLPDSSSMNTTFAEPKSLTTLNNTVSNMTPPLNQILFGPPGTGKTYNTITEALAILEPEFLQTNQDNRGKLKERFNELLTDGRIRFVTFHQSFSYEDFVEGLRAANDENGQLRYEIADGVFKTLCNAASVKVVQLSKDAIDLTGRRIWKMSLGNTRSDDARIYNECLTGGYVLLGWGGAIDFTGCRNRQDVVQRLQDSNAGSANPSDYEATSVTAFATKMKQGDLVIISDGNLKFRAIGEITGDYKFQPHDDYDGYSQMRPVKWLRQYSPSLPHTELMNKQFSQMSLYQPDIDLEKLAHLLQAESEDITVRKNDARVLIIDEINRGNISRIFGELITLIEPSKRAGADEALEVILPYSKERFSVPSNVYVIGTMNTADRSLAGLDIALRRRFTFKEMPPRPDLLDSITVEGVNIGAMLRVMNQRIEVLLGRDHCLGHAYFMLLSNKSDLPELADIFRRNIIPLLQEYFFEDWQRIRWVLNDHQKNNPEHQFITEDTSLKMASLFGTDKELPTEQTSWKLNLAAFGASESFLKIIHASALAQEEKPRSLQRNIPYGDWVIQDFGSGENRYRVLKLDVEYATAKAGLRDIAVELAIEEVAGSTTYQFADIVIKAIEEKQ